MTCDKFCSCLLDTLTEEKNIHSLRSQRHWKKYFFVVEGQKKFRKRELACAAINAATYWV